MASWPTSIPTDATLYIAVNELQTNLSAGINAAVTTVGLNSTTSFPTVGLVLIDNEIIKYTGVSGSTLTGCTRGFDGTTAAVHSSAAIVSFAICANHHNVTKDEIIALATYLSNNLGTGAQPLANGSRALASNGSGKIVESSVTSTELGYLSGVTSAIQTQLGLKAPLASPTFTGTVTVPPAANFALQTGTSSVLEASTTTKTELAFVHGVTSAIQTQLDAKAPLTSPTFVTPTLGAATATSITFSPTTSGIVGTTTNDAAAAGKVGEYAAVNSPTGGTATPGATGTYVNITSMTLTAGDWDVWATIRFDTGGTWVGTKYVAGLSLTSSTPDTTSAGGFVQQEYTIPASTINLISVGTRRISLSGSATVYLVGSLTYSTLGATTWSSNSALMARRAR